MGQFAEMFEELGIKKGYIIGGILLNILRMLAVVAGLAFIVLWIVTTNPVFGWALLWAAIAFVAASAVAMIMSLRLMSKV